MFQDYYERYCPVCKQWFRPHPQRAGMACNVWHPPGVCCHYSERAFKKFEPDPEIVRASA